MKKRQKSCDSIDFLIKSLHVNRYMKVLRDVNVSIDISVWRRKFQPLVELLNTCIVKYKQLKPFFIENPTHKQEILERYEELGLNQRFLLSLLYRSGRPKADMRDFLSYYDIEPVYGISKGNKLSHREDFYYLCDEEDGLYENISCNVVRYQVGMSGYFLINHYNIDYCGTFYYFEPDSEVFLEAATCLVTWNKITAAFELGMNKEEINVLLYNFVEDRTYLTPRLAGYEVDTWDEVVDLYINHELDPMYHYIDMYTAEDSFDQPLCLLAKERGIDIIVLKYMTGETRVVSEVVDSRNRTTSFESLIFEI